MAASVNSDRRARRTSGGISRWAARRFGPVVVTVAALVSVNWISPRLGGGPPPIAQPPVRERQQTPLSSKSAENGMKPLDKPGWVDAAARPAPPRPHRRRQALENSHSAAIDGFEVLNADELDAISQAH